VVAGAEITVKNVETGLSRQVLTNAQGVYRFPSLYPGMYEVRAAHSGFQSAVRSGIDLQVQQVARIDFELGVGPVTESVQVTGGWSLERCLSKEPAQRYEATRDLFLELRQWRDHASEITAASAAGHPGRLR
jgi:hypothetical protein